MKLARLIGQHVEKIEIHHKLSCGYADHLEHLLVAFLYIVGTKVCAQGRT